MKLNDPKLPSRFWEKVDLDERSGCWLWRASVDRGGYGQFYWGNRLRGSHVVSYEVLVSEVPEGLLLDHLCRTRRCVNPGHLEPVTHAENIRRGESFNGNKTHCPQQHPYSGANLRLKNGKRECRLCHNKRELERMRRVRSGVVSHPAA